MKGHNWGICKFCGKDHGLHPMLGKSPSDKTKEKLSIAGSLRRHSEEIKRKISLKLKGIPKSEETKRKMSLKRKGISKNSLSEEHKRKISLAKRGISGHLQTIETKDKIRKTVNETYKDENIRDKCRQKSLLRIFPKKDTTIERLFQQELDKRDIPYRKHVVLLNRYQVDLFIDRNIVIECDGDYWHNYPFGREEDKTRDKKLYDAGFRVLRFWEHEIINDLNRCSDYMESLLWSR